MVEFSRALPIPHASRKAGFKRVCISHLLLRASEGVTLKKSIHLTLAQRVTRSQRSNRILFFLGAFLLSVSTASSQTWDWAKNAGSNQNWETGMGVATDSSGNVYATGFAQGTSFTLPGFGFEDVFLAKYDASGALLWVTKCGGSGSDHGQGIAIDNAGYIYITGSFMGSAVFKSASPSTVSQTLTGGGGLDAYIAKYDPTGVLQWVTKVSSPFSADEEGTSIAVDQSGGVYITGYLGVGEGDFYNQPGNVFASNLTLSGNTPAIFLAKYTSAGTFVWRSGVQGPGANRGNGIAVNSGGTRVVVTGAFQGPVNFGNSVTLANSSSWSDIFVAVYDAGGVAQWAQQGGGTSTDAGNAIAIDSSDNVYVTGEFKNVASFYDNPATPSNGVSSPFTLTSHLSSGNSYTVDVVLAKYDQFGVKQWIAAPGGAGNDYPYGLVVDGSDVVITGWFEFTVSFGSPSISSLGNFDVFVARFNRTSGTANSAVRAGGFSNEGGRGVAASNFGVVYVTGAFQSNPASFGANMISAVGGSEDVFVAKLNSHFVTGTDLYIQDASNDVGNEPDNQAAILWASPDIWVQNIQDVLTSSNPPRFSNEHNHQNPEYATIPANTPWIYVKTRNRGATPVSGTLHIYWANASLGLNWQNDWQEVPISSANTITNLAPGAVWVVELQWTSIPHPSLSIGGHFCLLARFEPDISSPDPIVGEVVNNGIWGNVYNSNNLAWKNVTVVNNDTLNKQGRGPSGQVIVHNIRNRSSLTKLSLDASREDFGRFTRAGTISIDLGPKLFERWKRGGMVGNGVRAIGGTWLDVLVPNAWIGNLLLEPNEQDVVGVRFKLNGRLPEDIGNVLNFDLVQHEVRERTGEKPVVIGGERFVIELGRRAVIKGPGRPSEIQTKPTTFDGQKRKYGAWVTPQPKAPR